MQGLNNLVKSGKVLYLGISGMPHLLEACSTEQLELTVLHIQTPPRGLFHPPIDMLVSMVLPNSSFIKVDGMLYRGISRGIS